MTEHGSGNVNANWVKAPSENTLSPAVGQGTNLGKHNWHHCLCPVAQMGAGLYEAALTEMSISIIHINTPWENEGI